LRDQPIPVPKSVLRGLPPNVLAGKRDQVHEAILHGRRQIIRICKPPDTCAPRRPGSGRDECRGTMPRPRPSLCDDPATRICAVDKVTLGNGAFPTSA
jgi:hypothetical protein